MKKAILKGLVFAVTFFVSVLIISKIMNKGTNDLTVEMASATFPVVYMGMDGTTYNELHGYAEAMDTAYMRDSITVLSEARTTEFTIDTYGQPVSGISFEVRSVDGERLIENTAVTEYSQQANEITGKITVKDLIEKNTEYALIWKVDLEGQTVRYYTRIVWAEDYHLAEKLAFATSFSEKTFDKDDVQELAKYMETNSEGNSSNLHEVTIHSNLNQLSWGNLEVEKVTEPVFDVTELAEQTARLKADYVVKTTSGDEESYFYVEEFYRLRYTADRIYLLDYSRTMNSLLDEDADIYVNDKIMIGIADENLPLYESEDGNVFAFEMQNRLYSYNVTTNKMAVVFGFYDEENQDARTIYNQHGIEILEIDEGGNIHFVVYGYMNRGRYEGQVGVQVYYYDSALNTIEEILYIPSQVPYQVLKNQMEQLLYLNRESCLYLMLGDIVYEVNLSEKTYSQVLKVLQDDSLRVSENNKMAVWQSGGLYESRELILMNLGTGERFSITAGFNEYIMPLGFMEEDLVYGLAHKTDIVVDSAGRTIFPMYAVYIQNAQGKVLKEYSHEGVYVTGCSMQSNQISLERMIKLEDGTYEETTQDHIMNRVEEVVKRNTISTVVTENYGTFVQIAVKKDIDGKTLQILTPKEVLFEGGRQLVLEEEETAEKYYVYGADGVEGIFRSPARAVRLADEIAGVVVNDDGDYVWIRGNRVTRNQIMAIEKASVTEEKNSLAVCLDTMLAYEGVIRNTEYMLNQGETIYSILQDNLEDAQVLDLQGCSLDAILYYVNRDIPVLASLNDGNAVLIVGFNQYNVVIMDPSDGTLAKHGINDTAMWLEANGNSFITYIR